MKKKSIQFSRNYLLLLFTVLINSLVVAQGIVLPPESASIQFTNPITSNNMSLVIDNNAADEAYTEVATIGGVQCRKIPSGKFMYVSCTRSAVPISQNNLMIAVTYYANSNNSIWFNYNGISNSYQGADFQKTKTNQWVTVIIAMTDAALKGNMSGGGDFRMGYGGEDNYISGIKVYQGALNPVSQTIPSKPNSALSEFKNKSFAGYQIWHQAGSMAADWVHWSYGVIPAAGFHLDENIASFPDLSSYPDTDTYPTNLGNLGNGKPTRLYNDADSNIINRQMGWLQSAGLDGVAIQRFVGPIGRSITITPESHLTNVKKACEKTGRLFYICYDLNGSDATILQRMQTDWVYEIEQMRALTSSPNYATVNGKPVVEMWGIGYNMITSNQTCLDLIHFFQSRGCYVIGGTPRAWRTNSEGANPNFTDVYNALDCISPWTVGVYKDIPGANNYLTTKMVDDKNYCVANNIDYLPVAFAGSANWLSSDGTFSQTDRVGGKLLWQQILNAKSIGLNSVYFAMLDEFEESTNLINGAVDYFDIPTDQYFETFAKDGVWTSPDYYLRLASKAAQLLRGQIPVTQTIPIEYSLGPMYHRNSFESRTTLYNMNGAAATETLKIDPCFYNDVVISNAGISSPSVAIVNNPSFTKSGLYSVMASGTPTSSSSANYYYQVSKTKIGVKANMQLSFWKYSVNTLGQYTSVDLIFQSGKRLKNIPAYLDNNGNAMTPSIARGMIGTWQKFSSQIGVGQLIGDTITGIIIGYDHPSTSGSFTAYFDDIIIDDAPAPLPVNFTSIDAVRLNDEGVSILWTVANEVSMNQYDLERSIDGIHFTTIQTITKLGSSTYSVSDNEAPIGTAYYRIKGISINGVINYTTVRYVPSNKVMSSIVVYPNLVNAGETISIQFTNQDAVSFNIRLYNYLGQFVSQTSVRIVSALFIYSLDLLPQLSSGCYQLEVISESGNRMMQKIVVL